MVVTCLGFCFCCLVLFLFAPYVFVYMQLVFLVDLHWAIVSALFIYLCDSYVRIELIVNAVIACVCLIGLL